MANNLLTGLQMYNSAVGSVFKDRLHGGLYDFANHGGGCTFAADATWDTGRVAITPGDGTSWLALARTLLDPVLHVENSLTEPWTIAIAFRYLSFNAAAFQDLMDWGDEFYAERVTAGTLSAQWLAFGSVIGGSNSLRPVAGVNHILIATFNGTPGSSGAPSYRVIFDNTGILDSANSSYSQVLGANDANDITLGDYYPSGDPANVAIGGLAKWNRALSATEQTALYNGGRFLDFSHFDVGGGVAASITISGLVIAADGVTLTGTLAGGSGTGYAPATVVTNFSLVVGGIPRRLSRSVIAGTAWSATAYTPVLVGQAVTLSVVAGNLVDSAANTAVITSGVAVTNNSVQTSIASALSNIPANSLNAWKTALALNGSQLVETVVFGDSTTHGDSTASQPNFLATYSWTQKLRALALAAGYGDGGRGVVGNADFLVLSGENLVAYTAQTGFAVPGFGMLLGNTFTSNTASDTITFQGFGTSARLYYASFAAPAQFTYSVNGGAPITVTPILALGGVGNFCQSLLITGLIGGGFVNTIKVINLGGAPYPLPIPFTPGGTNNAGSLLALNTRYNYVWVGKNASGTTLQSGEVFATTNSGVKQTLSLSMLNRTGITSYDVYRSTGATGGPYGFLKNVVASGGTGTNTTGPQDDGSITPNMGINPPTVYSAGLDTVPKQCAVCVDFLQATGVVIHKQGISGINFINYFYTAGSSGYNAEARECFGFNSAPGAYVQGAAPLHRRPKLAICALGINGELPGVTDTTPVTLGTQVFQDMCTAAGATAFMCIPHYCVSSNPFAAGPFVDAHKAIANTNNMPWIDFNVILDSIGYGGTALNIGPHIGSAGYDLFGQAVFNLLFANASKLLLARRRRLAA